MEHIRQQRCLPGYTPDTRHVIHGLDADLIMLALATHEPHFCILREVVLDRKAKEKQEQQIAMGNLPGPPKMQFLQVWVLREYLQREFSLGLDWSQVPGGFDLEKVIDDFVYMCFFVGNDFLPHIPALEIRDGAIDMLICAYKHLLPRLGGYLPDAGRVHLPRTELLLREVASYEEEIFERRRRREEGMERSRNAREAAQSGVVDQNAFGGLYPPRDATQRQYYEAMKAFAQGGEEGTVMTFPPNLSGFHKASVHLYVTLLGLGESTGPNKEILVRHKKKRDDAAASKGTVIAKADDLQTSLEEGDEGGEGELVTDFEERLKVRMDKLEEEAAAVRALVD